MSERIPRDSGAASAPETGGSADGGREHGHSPRPASGADGAPEPRPGEAAPPHKPRHKHHDVPPSVPVGTPEAPVAAASQPALKAEPGEADEGPRPDLEALAARAEKADEYLELAQRTKADFENYRKRALREAAAAQDRGVAKLAMELLPAVDNLDRALEAADAAAPDGAADVDGAASPLIDGIKLVHADVIAALARVGIEPFSPQGEPFDPQHHEAIAQQPVDGARSGTVVEVYQRGYRLGDTILRPARVVVAA